MITMTNPDFQSPSLNLSYDVNSSSFFKKDDNNYINVLSNVQLSSLENVSLLDIFLSEGQTIEPHWHPSEAELVYTISGELFIGILNGFTNQVLHYRLKPGQVVNIPKGWWHWETALTDQTHALAIFDQPAPTVVFGSDVLRFTPKEVFAHTYCLNEEQIASALQPITKTVVIGPPANCMRPVGANGQHHDEQRAYLQSHAHLHPSQRQQQLHQPQHPQAALPQPHYNYQSLYQPCPHHQYPMTRTLSHYIPR